MKFLTCPLQPALLTLLLCVKVEDLLRVSYSELSGQCLPFSSTCYGLNKVSPHPIQNFLLTFKPPCEVARKWKQSRMIQIGLLQGNVG